LSHHSIVLGLGVGMFLSFSLSVVISRLDMIISFVLERHCSLGCCAQNCAIRLRSSA